MALYIPETIFLYNVFDFETITLQLLREIY